MPKKIISIIIPVHNEEANISLIFEAVKKVFSKEKKYSYEIIFIDDGSYDNSILEIKKLSQKNKKIHFLEFARNFGKESATSAGLHHAKGEAVIMIDADLQHPPQLISDFLRKWENGAEIVVGVRKKNRKAGFVKRICSKFYYKIINLITEGVISPGATDFRLLDKKVLKELNCLTERNRMTRALIDWLGFKRDYVYFEADIRANGESSYSFIKLIKLAIDSMVAMSFLPLKLAGYLGIFIVFISGPLGLFIFIEKYILKDSLNLAFSGPAILAVIILFLVGIILICLGLMALYIANIHSEVLNRPMYIIRNKKFK